MTIELQKPSTVAGDDSRLISYALSEMFTLEIAELFDAKRLWLRYGDGIHERGELKIHNESSAGDFSLGSLLTMGKVKDERRYSNWVLYEPDPSINSLLHGNLLQVQPEARILAIVHNDCYIPPRDRDDKRDGLRLPNLSLNIVPNSHEGLAMLVENYQKAPDIKLIEPPVPSGG